MHPPILNFVYKRKRENLIYRFKELIDQTKMKINYFTIKNAIQSWNINISEYKDNMFYTPCSNYKMNMFKYCNIL